MPGRESLVCFTRCSAALQPKVIARDMEKGAAEPADRRAETAARDGLVEFANRIRCYSLLGLAATVRLNPSSNGTIGR